MPQNQVIVGLDVGSTKTTAIVGELMKSQEVKIIGVGEAPSNGLRKGVVVDIDGIARSIEQAVKAAERMSGQNISSVYVGVTGSRIFSINNRGIVAVGNEDAEISESDAERVISAAKVVNLSMDKQVIHVIPRQYIVDGYDGVLDPIGMAGTRLEAEVNIIIGENASMQNLAKAVHKAGLDVNGFILNPLASSESVVQASEKGLPLVVVDIGGGTTEIALFDEDGLWFVSVLPIGGNHVTNDLAIGLRVSLSQAEQIKIEHGCVLNDLMPAEEDIPISHSDVHGDKKVSKKTISSIIEPRMQEIFSMVAQEIKSSGCKNVLPGGILITGGGCLLDGIQELASDMMGIPVKTAFPSNISGMTDMVNDPRYATGIGIILYVASTKVGQKEVIYEDRSLLGYFNKIKTWLNDLF